jgi:hypothetical protein
MDVKMATSIDLNPVKLGLVLALLTVILNIGLGATFGLNEDLFQTYIHDGIAANAALFKDAAREQDIIWRFIQRAHFHAGGIGAFTLGLIVLTALTGMSRTRKQITALLLGLSIFYPLAWVDIFIYAPYIGRAAAHHTFHAELLTGIGVGGLTLGLLSLILGIFLPGRQQEA